MGIHISLIVLLQLVTLGWIRCAYYLSNHDNVFTWRNQFQKLTKIWRKYIDSALTKYIQHSIENIVGFNKMFLRYLDIILLETTNCRNQIESQLEFYNHTVKRVCEALHEGPIELRLVLRSLLTVTLNKTQPVGQECIQVEYTTYNNVGVLLNEENLDYFWQVDKLAYVFYLHNTLGLNLTFVTFSMSDMCFMEHRDKKRYTCFRHRDTEYMMISQAKELNSKSLCFCMKRSQWSIFTANIIQIFV